MPSQDAAVCLCGNTRPVTVECESVCRGCGVVLGVERHPEGPGTGRLSLFLRLENGGRAAALPGRTKKLHIHGSDMGSNRIKDSENQVVLPDLASASGTFDSSGVVRRLIRQDRSIICGKPGAFLPWNFPLKTRRELLAGCHA